MNTIHLIYPFDLKKRKTPWEEGNQIYFALKDKFYFKFYSWLSIGKINLNCHVSNEPFDYDHNSKMELIVKFGPEFNNENDELIILPIGSNEINISQQLFEMIILSLPIKIAHPGVENGTLETETLKKLKDFESFKTNKQRTDPRWDKLKDLI